MADSQNRKAARAKRRNKAQPAGNADPDPDPTTTSALGKPAQSPPAAPVAANDNDEPPPTAPMAAALARPRRQLSDAVASPRVVAKVIRFRPRIGRLDDHFFSVELPELNNSVSREVLKAADFAASLAARLTRDDLDGIARVAPGLGDEGALFVQGALGVIASSLMRHVRVETGDDTTSAGLGLVNGLEETLLAVAQVTGLAPRDQEATSWRYGGPDGPPWSWTGTDGERRFGQAVREAERLLGNAGDLLWPIRSGSVDFAQAASIIDEATALVLEYRAIQANLASQPFGRDFLSMRNYLGAFTVGGIRWEGPNATYAPAWNGLDLAVGILGTDFHHIVRKRASHMAPRDRAYIERSIELPSLARLLAERLRVSALDDLEPAMLDNLVRRAALLDVSVAVGRLAQATAQLASVHLSAIRRNLEDPVAEMTADERKALGVSPEHGVSTTPLRLTYDLRDRRMHHPLVRWLTLFGRRTS